MTENQAYDQGAQHPLDWHANGLPAIRKEVEPDAIMTRSGQIIIHTDNQAGIFETDKTAGKTVHRSLFYDDIPEPEPEGSDSVAY